MVASSDGRAAAVVVGATFSAGVSGRKAGASACRLLALLALPTMRGQNEVAEGLRWHSVTSSTDSMIGGTSHSPLPTREGISTQQGDSLMQQGESLSMVELNGDREGVDVENSLKHFSRGAIGDSRRVDGDESLNEGRLGIADIPLGKTGWLCYD